MNSDRNIVLLGFMGTGKSAVGQILARRLGLDFVDLDKRIEADAGAVIPEIFRSEGEDGFRARERRAVQEVSLRSGLVIASGGGVVLNPDNVRDLDSTGSLVCLTATPETILSRVGGDSERPLLQGGAPLSRIRDLLIRRSPYYAGIAVQVATDGLGADAVADAVLAALVAGGRHNTPQSIGKAEPSAVRLN